MMLDAAHEARMCAAIARTLATVHDAPQLRTEHWGGSSLCRYALVDPCTRITYPPLYTALAPGMTPYDCDPCGVGNPVWVEWCCVCAEVFVGGEWRVTHLYMVVAGREAAAMAVEQRVAMLRGGRLC